MFVKKCVMIVDFLKIYNTHLSKTLKLQKSDRKNHDIMQISPYVYSLLF